MNKNKLQNTVKEVLDTDYGSLHHEWQNCEPNWLIENAQLVYVAKEVYKELDEFDFETMKFILNHHSPICAIAEKHIESYDTPTQESIYEALWDLVDESINEKLARDENANVNEDDPKLRTIRDMVTQFPECDFDLMGDQEYICFTAEEGQQMLKGLPLVLPKERYGFIVTHPAEEILDQAITGDIKFEDGTFHFRVSNHAVEQTDTFEMTMGGGMC